MTATASTPRHASRRARATTPFVGRERELDELRGALAAAESRTSRLILLLGEPGVGKTRLASEIADEARDHGWAVVVARCPEGDEGTPSYWPWAQVLRGLVPQVASLERLRARLGAQAGDLEHLVPALADAAPRRETPALGADAARFRFFDSVCGFVRAVADEVPTLLVVEDLHGADVDSLRLLRFVVGELVSARLVVVGTYRDVEITRDHPFSSILAELVREAGATSIPLSGFTEDEVATFVDRMAGAAPGAELTSELYRRTEGNPFFVTEVVRLLIAEGYGKGGSDAVVGVEIPTGVREVVRKRLRRLSAITYETLEMGALLGRDVDLFLLEQLSGRTSLELLSRLDEALAARIVTRVAGAPSRLRFAHALVRETIYEDIGSGRRVEMHRRVGEILEVTGSSSVEGLFGDLVRHFEQSTFAGDARKAVTYATRAARAARSQFAYAEAAGYLERAVSWLERDVTHDPVELCDLTLELANARIIAGNPSVARETFRRAGAMAERFGLAEQLALAAVGVSGPVVRFGIIDHGAISLLESALRLLPSDARGLRARVLARLAIELQYSAPLERRIAMTEEAMQIARELGDVKTLSDLMVERRSRRWRSESVEQRLADSAALIRLADQSGDVELGLDARGWRIIDLLEVGDMDTVKHEADAYAAMAEPLRLPIYAHRAVAYQTIRAMLEGRLDDAESLSLEYFAIARRVSDWQANASFVAQCFLIRRLRGSSFGGVLEAAERFVADHPALAPTRAGLAVGYLALGREAEARREYERFAEHDFALVSEDIFWAGTVAFLCELCAAFDDAPRAARLYEMLSPFAGRCAVFGLGGSLGSVARPLGVLATTMGDYAAAERHFAAAIAANDRMGAVPFAALARHAYAEMLLRRAERGDRVQARQLLAAALETACRLGMAGLERDARASLERSNVAEPAPAPACPPGEAVPERGGVAAGGRLAPATGHGAVVGGRAGVLWAGGFADAPLRLRDSIGVRCVAELLRRPHEEVLALDLARLAAGTLASSQDAAPSVGRLGPVVDAQARAEYRARLVELRDRLERARQLQDDASAGRIQDEIDAVAGELSRALGLRGRERTAGGPLERARVNVTRTIREAIRRVEAHDAELGRHLRASIRTGTFCGYFPAAGRGPRWSS